MQKEYENFGDNVYGNNSNLYRLFQQLMLNRAPQTGFGATMGGYANPDYQQSGMLGGLVGLGKNIFDKAKARENDGMYKGQQVNNFDPSMGEPIVSLGGGSMSDRAKAEMYGVGGNAPTVGGMPMTNPLTNSIQDNFQNNNNNIIGGF